MLKIKKRSDRKDRVDQMLAIFRKCGFETSHMGEYCKWKELSIGGKLQISVNIYKIHNPQDGNTCYMMGDTLGMNMLAEFALDIQEIYAWLADKGYKTDRQWYIEDYGMNAETFDSWNTAEE